MDAKLFDSMSKALITAANRRSTLAAALGGALGLGGLAESEASKNGKCKPKCDECNKCNKGKCKRKNGKKHCKKGSCVPKENGTGCTLSNGDSGTCQNGACAAVGPNCDEGLTDCNGICVNLQTDAENCGTCGDSCGTNAFCQAGTCAPIVESTNNLSYPVIWADGSALVIPGTELESSLLGPSTTDQDGTWYWQGFEGNVWQAGNEDAGGSVSVSNVAWGDNLNRSWRLGQKVRVETVLYTNPTTLLQGFEMKLLGGQGINELWGSNGVLYEPSDLGNATVYTQLANLTIQKLDGSGDPVGSPVVDEDYTSEINVQGKVIFGTQWNTATAANGAGTYRLTMSFDAGTNISLAGAATDLGEIVGNTAVIEVVLTA